MASVFPLFLTYRRLDSAPWTALLHRDLDQAFGADIAFRDTDAIRVSQDWEQRLHSALAECRMLVAMIGPKWLSITGEGYIRRIDEDGDWVRKEIESALARGVPVLPVRVGGAVPIQRKHLPASLRTLGEGVALSDDSWGHDLERVLVEVERATGRERRPASVAIPRSEGRAGDKRRALLRASELSDAQVIEALRDLPGWKLVPAHDPKARNHVPVDIEKPYEFKRGKTGFLDAMAFMQAAAPHIDKLNHHPRWENTWATVTVRLSTWDLGHRVSMLDVELARYLDQLYDARVRRDA